MDQMQYAMLSEVPGRWKADSIESFLRSEEIDAVLIQDAVAASTQQTSFTPVKVYVPRVRVMQPRELLKSFEEG